MIDYSKVVIPDSYTILGLKLKPFCIGHFILMDRLNCGIVNPDAMLNIDDFLLALAICSRGYKEFLEFAKDEKGFQKWCHKWGKAVRKQMKKEKEDFNLFARFYLFKKYMEEGTSAPEFLDTDNSDSQSSSSHWIEAITLFLVKEMGYAHNDAMEVSLAQALSDYVKFLETKGLVRKPVKADETALKEWQELQRQNWIKLQESKGL